jgi:hypothetical protein
MGGSLVALQGYTVEPISYQFAKAFVEKWHYSHSTNGLKITQCFGLFREGEFFPQLVGAALYGLPAMTNQASAWNPSNPSVVLELRRLCCIDDTPKNAESFFISRTLKWLRKHTDTELIISYADTNHGHDGTIYKASNFKYEGITASGVVLMVDGKQYHDRTLRNPKPYAKKIRERYEAGDAGIKLVPQKPKNIYTYRLR